MIKYDDLRPGMNCLMATDNPADLADEFNGEIDGLVHVSIASVCPIKYYCGLAQDTILIHDHETDKKKYYNSSICEQLFESEEGFIAELIRSKVESIEHEMAQIGNQLVCISKDLVHVRRLANYIESSKNTSET